MYFPYDVIMSMITEVLSISGNFGGTLPTELARMKKLAYLNLSNCSLTGTIPSIFQNMNELGMFCSDKYLVSVQSSSFYLTPFVICFLNIFVFYLQGIFLWEIITLLARSHLPLGN